MEIKSNESTALRPMDDRLFNASLVEIDLNKFIAQLKQETAWQTVTVTPLLFLNQAI